MSLINIYKEDDTTLYAKLATHEDGWNWRDSFMGVIDLCCAIRSVIDKACAKGLETVSVTLTHEMWDTIEKALREYKRGRMAKNVFYMEPSTLVVPNVYTLQRDVYRALADVFGAEPVEGLEKNRHCVPVLDWQVVTYDDRYRAREIPEEAKLVLDALEKHGVTVNHLKDRTRIVRDNIYGGQYGEGLMQMTEMNPFEPVGGDADGNTD